MGIHKAENNLKSIGCIEFIINSPTLTRAETIKKCKSVIEMRPSCVWVKPCYVQPAVALLRGEGVQVGTLIGCLDGSTHTQIKVAEAKRALTEGALRLAAPVNVGFARKEAKQDLLKDLHAMSGIAHMNGAAFEMILKPDFLDMKEMLEVSLIAKPANVDVISFPVDDSDWDWSANLVAPLRKQHGEDVELKGLLRHVNQTDLRQLFTKGLDRLGINQINT